MTGFILGLIVGTLLGNEVANRFGWDLWESLRGFYRRFREMQRR